MHRLSLLSLLCLGLLLGACSRRQPPERRGTYAQPRNALEASYQWAGRKTDLRGPEDKLQLRLRTRRAGLKVLDENLQAVGYVRHREDMLLLEGTDRKPIYLIEPLTDPKADIPEGTLVHRVYGVTGSDAPKEGEAATLERGDWIVDLYQSAEEAWSLRYPGTASDVQQHDLRAHKVEGEQAQWRVEGKALKSRGPITLRQEQGTGPRTLVALDKKQQIVTRIQSKTMAPGAMLPVLDQEIPSLVRAGLLSLLQTRLAPSATPEMVEPEEDTPAKPAPEDAPAVEGDKEG